MLEVWMKATQTYSVFIWDITSQRGNPFSTESPLIAKNFLAALNPILDQIFNLQGWRLKHWIS